MELVNRNKQILRIAMKEFPPSVTWNISIVPVLELYLEDFILPPEFLQANTGCSTKSYIKVTS